MKTKEQPKIAPALIEPKEFPPVAKILYEARQQLAKRGGWCQGSYHNGFASCMLGAINEDQGWNAFINDAADYLVAALPKGWEEVVDYNDEPGRKKRQVIAVYDKAIAKALENEE